MKVPKATRILDYEHEAYSKVSGGEVLDSDWACTCALTVVTNELNNDAYVYHHWITEDQQFLDDVLSDFGGRIKEVIVSGCSIMLSDAGPLFGVATKEDKIEEVRYRIQKRQQFVQALVAGLQIDIGKVSIKWGKGGSDTKIVYDSGTGICHLLRQPASADLKGVYNL